ncbi:MAG: hypothetical protein B7Y12_03840 [Rhizobiales bacterium 24-66-13]|jgi:hypothetical protein|nr:MAG: hypothetical protein B7Z41_06510 [Rhizobiales bacterium 12-66-7]OYY88149.1 MAG: hypothetical protein B7Y61_03555 [Rhizobiales bacterium 35-66-30]OYZ82362.1 MAG: hypothetical protein B7Y12_03840 [Rhizobiales bacterium 24-66-13]OZB10706.1 MAG: hypothetical protein B7X67_06085 [Rhizobiales bacterium 39-66-18]
MSPDLALQKALLDRLAATPDVTALVPAAAMIDGHGLPQRFPSILVGEGQVVREPITIAGRHRRVYATLHIWTQSMPHARAIGGAIFAAIEHEQLRLDGENRAISTVVADARFLRDPDGETAHGVVTVDSLIEVAS